ncbi:RHS repeat-associated core domain-containing protein [Polyangium sp. 6x1]|uniref:RHS repeat-associated core domain-containing protein n=1 Tax=Polyangium sp. 6x1 TaxID=3042689 RepID=UPI002483143C|nr:RHS repeat-associated core domain-containing protein [Polyangium sp. 6x1]MDI1443569.1 RHS repeat-associated core domain-containing protein [Polyangium sp. 6x1]
MGSGGGDGDGSGGGSGNGGDGSGNGDGAGGDGKGAQGAPDYKKYPECGYASHPVDVVTGRAFTHPIVDLELPGPLPLVFHRMYSSKMADRDVGLGYGWGHTFGWEVEVGRRGIRVWNEQGIAVDFPMVPVGGEVIGPWGWVLRREAWGFVVDADDGVWRSFSASASGSKRHRLVSIHDRNRNEIRLKYAEERIVEIIDSAGRSVRVRTTPDGRMTSIEVNNALSQGKWIAFARYEYDERGNLVKATDACGYSSTYRYDEHHRMTMDTDRVGLTFHFRYDEQDRCVESWGQYLGTADPSLGSRPLPARLRDGVTTAKGIHHCALFYGPNGYTEVSDSTEVRRYFGNEHGTLDRRVEGGATISATYDDHGHMLSRTDAMGGTVVYKRDARGRLLQLTDVLGRTTTFERDAYGLVTQVISPAGGVRKIQRDRCGNPVLQVDEVGAITSCKYDDRGALIELTDPSGHLTTYAYDAHGNLASVKHANGAVYRYTYDALGRRLSETDPLGATRRYTYSDRGELVAMSDPLGGVSRYAYDGEERIVAMTSPTGRATHVVWGGYHKVCGVQDGNGHWVKFVYDAEGQPLEIHNELGEVHRYEYTPNGFILSETTFDGTETQYRYDHAGQLVQIRDALGRVTQLVRNAVGAVVERHLPGGIIETFEHDGLDNVIRTSNGHSTVLLERDITGRILRETQLFGDVSHSIESRWSPWGDRLERRTSLGSHIQHQHDTSSGKDHLLLAPRQAVRREFDLLGREVARNLPRGGRIESAFDVAGRLVRRGVSSPFPSHDTGQGHPEWVGERSDGRTFQQTYIYNAEGELEAIMDHLQGPRRYVHDPIGQLLAATPASMHGELFRFDAAGNIHEVTPHGPVPTEYGQGNRLLQWGPSRYRWDELGQLVEKRTLTDRGAERVTRYAWGTAGQLLAVERDDIRVEFTYDPFFRRIEKRVLKRTAPDRSAVLVSRTRFVWDGNVLAHDVEETLTAAGDPVVSERSYCFEEGGFVPLAQRESRRYKNDVVEGDWIYYVNGPAGAPERLVAADGTIVCEIRLSAWGHAELARCESTKTPIRFQGQYEDEETGLYYNGFRYYDPETGRYISQDPLGIAGGLNLYRYVEDPLGRIDPLGLAGRCTCTIITKEPVGGKKKFTGDSSDAEGHHKAVNKALSKTALPKGVDKPGHPKGVCAEPRAMTGYLNAWEAEHGKIENHADLQKALNNIKSIDPHDNVLDKRKKLCNWCRQFLPALGGKKLLDKAKQDGAVD